jgi:hypothetical protein
MTKIRTALVAALAISSLLAGGVAAANHSAPRPAHHVAGAGACCEDDGIINI